MRKTYSFSNSCRVIIRVGMSVISVPLAAIDCYINNYFKDKDGEQTNE